MKKEKDKRRSKRMLLLLLLLFMTGTMLVTSTYAWFTSNETVTVNTITVNVKAEGGIQLSADGTNWKTLLLTTDLTGVHATTYTASVNQIPAQLEPVSTGLNVDATGKLEMFYGTVQANSDGDFILTAVQSVETESNGSNSTGKFVAFDLFFKSEDATSLYLTGDSGVTTSDATDKGIKNAARVAFVVLGNTTVDDTVAHIQALGTSNATSSPVYMWEPNYDVHTSNAVAHARDTYAITTTTTSAARISYDGVIAPISAANDVELGDANATTYSSYFQSVTPSYTTVEGNSNSTQIFSLSGGVTKVRVYMWVEGQDVDCENTASGGNINYDLVFSINS